MRKLFILVLALFSFTIANAQFLRFGVKGGVSSTNVKIDETSLQGLTTTDGLKQFAVEQGNSKLGLHFGVFGRIQLAGLFIQPEILFTQSKGEVVLSYINSADEAIQTVEDQKFNKIDIPVMVGWKFGPARIGLGPVASIMLSENDGLKKELASLTSQSAESNFKNAVFGYQLVAGIDILKKITFDFKYEGNLSKLGEGITLGGSDYKFDQRNPQFIFSLGIFF